MAVALVVVVATLADVQQRAQAPEAAIRAYFVALETGEVEAALGFIVPDRRNQWSEFVANGVLNEYGVMGIAIRQPSLLARATRSVDQPRQATIFLQITPWTADKPWYATPRVPLRQVDGRWFLERPPLAP